jgi:hypothetical protein
VIFKKKAVFEVSEARRKEISFTTVQIHRQRGTTYLEKHSEHYSGTPTPPAGTGATPNNKHNSTQTALIFFVGGGPYIPRGVGASRVFNLDR